ncbi:uncharacterized protein LOC143022606 [Oratosquilla oratoria]|uniref:uncharacterized protein LOC143022606 n=1 Tax=Oratosquilla oratoria TaxID=337810 RepID=UPI003F7669B0
MLLTVVSVMSAPHWAPTPSHDNGNGNSGQAAAQPSGSEVLLKLLSTPEARKLVDQVMPIVLSLVSLVRSLVEAAANNPALTQSIATPKTAHAPAIPAHVTKAPWETARW